MVGKAEDIRIEIPRKVQRVLAALEGAGFEAFVVGGCVRDALMGRVANDWDITTNALPQQTREACEAAGFAVFDTGIEHGTVTVHVDHESFEVTTYRADGNYSDGRHPDSVTFLPSIDGDLARRDFTVNALAYSERTGLVDLYGGLEDLAARRLRSVGDAHKRFAEDGLRIIRGIRFSSVLGFAIEDATARAIHEDRELLLSVAMERISAEFMKLICGEGAVRALLEYRDVIATFLPQLEPEFDFDQRSPYHVYDVWEHSVRSCGCMEPDPVLRLAALVHDIGKPSTFTVDETGRGHFYGHAEAGTAIAEDVCRTLKLSNTIRKQVVTLVKYHDRTLPMTAKSMRRMIAKLGEQTCRELYKLFAADKITHSGLKQVENLQALEYSKQLFEETLATMTAFSERDLAIDGRDLIALGFERGPILGELKSELFAKVIDQELPNTREALLAYAQTKLPINE